MTVEAAAAFLAEARCARTRMSGLPPELRPADVATAYRVQDALHAALADAGLGALAGYKIGCTTPVMQQYLKIDHPCAGGVLAARVYRDAARLRHGAFVRVGVECEIAVLLGRDLPPRERPYAPADVAPAVEACAAGIEIVDDRWVDYRAVDTPTLVADDFFNSGCVLGPLRPFDAARDLAAVRGAMSVNGREVGRGTGTDALGSPLNALAWLASTRDGLRAGEFVLTGSMVQTHWAARGDLCAVELEGLGAAHVSFE
ncbi:MAG TPA: fumarylacetoacetate hydrolase family protein [Burkholderiales bacterium]|nr:fumarylacetoacetate hydrolase family protein [Burkholderiales bacterium]